MNAFTLCLWWAEAINFAKWLQSHQAGGSVFVFVRELLNSLRDDITSRSSYGSKQKGLCRRWSAAYTGKWFYVKQTTHNPLSKSKAVLPEEQTNEGEDESTWKRKENRERILDPMELKAFFNFISYMNQFLKRGYYICAKNTFFLRMGSSGAFIH